MCHVIDRLIATRAVGRNDSWWWSSWGGYLECLAWWSVATIQISSPSGGGRNPKLMLATRRERHRLLWRWSFIILLAKCVGPFDSRGRSTTTKIWRRPAQQHRHHDEDKFRISNFKFSLPKFLGSNDPKAYLSWTLKVNKIFQIHHFLQNEMVAMTSFKFEDYARPLADTMTPCAQCPVDMLDRHARFGGRSLHVKTFRLRMHATT